MTGSVKSGRTLPVALLLPDFAALNPGYDATTYAVITGESG